MYNQETSPTPTPISFDTEVPVIQNSPNFVRRGVREGATIATKAAVAYAVLLGFSAPLWSGVPDFFSIQSALFSIIVAFVIGVVPAQIVGAVGGVILGVIFQQLPKQATLPIALTIGMMGGSLLLAPLILVVAFLFFREDESQGMLVPFGMIWGFPALVALLGFAWVGYRLNALEPRARNS